MKILGAIFTWARNWDQSLLEANFLGNKFWGASFGGNILLGGKVLGRKFGSKKYFLMIFCE